MPNIKTVVGVTVVSVVVVVCVIVYSVKDLKKKKQECPQGLFSKAAVAADTKICSQTGRDILKQGGSAVDAAIAVLLCTSILNPQSAGIGGGSIFTVMDSSGKVKIIISRETAPSNVSPDLLNSCPFSVSSGDKWIGVPGEIRGYAKVHNLYGKLPWAALFQPTIKMAREGIYISEVLGSNIHKIKNNNNETQNLWKLFSDEKGNQLKTGDILKFEKLADTLETIANEGAESFYTGKIAEDLIHDIEDAGGKLTLQDLASYEVSVTNAWTVPLGEYQMFIPPPPAGGALVSFVLNVLKGYPMKSAPQTVDEKALFYHRYIEAFKFANGLKQLIRDPRFKSDKVPAAEDLIDESFADNIRNNITDETHDLKYYNNIPYADIGGTTHVSVLAEDGSAVSVTSSINDPFGSCIYSPRTGIILNNQLSDFCNRAEGITPGERPPSSMAPAILKSQSKTLVIGGSGGNFITTGMASALINHLWFGKSLKEAIAAPVIFVKKSNVMIEPNFDKNLITVLQARGQEVLKFYNVVNAVEKKNNYICAESDARKQGEAAGY